MAQPRFYLDANATEPLRPEARAAVLAALDTLGNPSSIHGEGRAARRLLEDAREAIAGRFGAAPRDLIFTSGGTEANALAIHGLAGGGRVLRGATEHPAVIAAAGDGAGILPVDGNGLIKLDALAERLAAERPALVCLMLANNETGTIQPIAEAAALCHAMGVLLHVDAVQAAGRIPLDLAALGADSVTLSAHKLGGPTGAGGLLLTACAAARLAPLQLGGGQERGRRGGTPALPNIAGFAAAALAARPEAAASLALLRDAIEAAAVASGAIVIGAARAAAAEYDLRCSARGAGGIAGDRARSRGAVGFGGLGLLLREGGPQPCAGGDGLRRLSGRGHPCLAALECRGPIMCRFSPPPMRRWQEAMGRKAA